MKTYLSIIFAGILAFGIVGCDNDGPAENAGEEIDEAASDVKRSVEDATD